MIDKMSYHIEKYNTLLKDSLKRIQFKNENIEDLIILCQKILSDEIFRSHVLKRRRFNNKLDKIMDKILERSLNDETNKNI